jgi:glycerophosphoryl diester phosphodiesterase
LLNENIHLSEGNIKSKNTDDVFFLTWSLPSRITCPYKTDLCQKKCFAKKNETFAGVRNSRQKNLEETKKESFVKDIIEILEYQLLRKATKNKKVYVRIHTSGDFYSKDYFDKWVQIAENFKTNEKILFQAYTKSIPYIKEDLSSVNIHLVYSIWHDTKLSHIEKAKEIGLQTFTALPKNEIVEAIGNGAFLCNGDCGNCKECYTGKSKSIVIPYH